MPAAEGGRGMTLHLELDTNHWHCGDTLWFAWSAMAREYLTDRGEPLGRVWDEAKRKAEALAEERTAPGWVQKQARRKV